MHFSPIYESSVIKCCWLASLTKKLRRSFKRELSGKNIPSHTAKNISSAIGRLQFIAASPVLAFSGFGKDITNSTSSLRGLAKDVRCEGGANRLAARGTGEQLAANLECLSIPKGYTVQAA